MDQALVFSFLRIEYKHQNRNLQHVKIFWKLEKWVGLKNGAIWQEDITGTDWILLVWWPRGHRAGQSWNLQNSSAFLIQKSTKITLAYCCVIHECFSKFNALPLKNYKVTPAQCFIINFKSCPYHKKLCLITRQIPIIATMISISELKPCIKD